MFGNRHHLGRELTPFLKVLNRCGRLSASLALVFVASLLVSFGALVFSVPSPPARLSQGVVSLPLPELPQTAMIEPPGAVIEPSLPSLAAIGTSPLLPSDLPSPTLETGESIPSIATETKSHPPEAEPDYQVPAHERLATLPPPSTLRSPDAVPLWRRHAVAMAPSAGQPLIAIVIDDMGLDLRRSARAIKLPGPLTLSFLPYGRDLPQQTATAHGKGHELMVHVSMQPEGTGNNPGPNALTVDLTPEEIKNRLDWALAAFPGYVGINNHMGSRFTANRAGMAAVMAELKARGLLFLDSRTGQNSVGMSTAAAYEVPHAARHVFLDNEISAAEVTRQLAETERIARQAGFAVAIGHPHDVTLAALEAWLPTLAAKGFVLAPVSAVVARLEARRGVSQTSEAPPVR